MRNARRPEGELNEADRQALRKLHQTIRKITGDFDSRWHFNTSIASLMELVNELYSLEEKLSPAALREILEGLTLMLAPFAPYSAQDLWDNLGHGAPVFRESWPRFDADLAKEDASRDRCAGERQSSRACAGFVWRATGSRSKQLALDNDKVQPFLEGKQVVKIIVVPDKLVNIVVR